MNVEQVEQVEHDPTQSSSYTHTCARVRLRVVWIGSCSTCSRYQHTGI